MGKQKSLTRHVYELCFKWVGPHKAAILESRLMAIFRRELASVRASMRCCGNCEYFDPACMKCFVPEPKTQTFKHWEPRKAVRR